MAKAHNLKLKNIYKHAINGYAAIIEPDKLEKVINDKRVQYVVQDKLVVIDFCFSSRRRHTRSLRDWSSTCALPISPFSGAKSEGGGGTGHEVGAATKGDRDGEVGNIYHLFEKKGGAPSEKSTVDPFP